MPNFTTSTAGPTLSTAQEISLIVMSLGLYGAFLAVQAGRHRHFFVMGEEEESHDVHGTSHSLGIHGLLLAALIGGSLALAMQPPGRIGVLNGA